MSGYIILDIENNGLFLFDEVVNGVKVKVPADDPRQPRMAEIGMIFTNDRFGFERDYTALIQRDGWAMTPGATAVNGITDDMLDVDGIPVAKALQVYTDAILGEGRTVISYHAQNDTKQLRGELRRAGMDDMFELTKNICAMRSTMAGKLGIKKLNGKGGYPRLLDVCAHFGHEQEPEPHRALTGARALYNVVQTLAAMDLLLPAAVHYAKNPNKEEA